MQGDLEAALSRIADTPLTSSCAGRTDAGVHALAQVVNFPLAPDHLDLERLPRSVASICGPSIAINEVRPMPEGWDARSHARSRTYVYALLEAGPPDPFLAPFSWHRPGALDLEVMREAGGHLLGEHDFSSFGRVIQPGGSAVRTLFELDARRRGGIVAIKARANSFVQQMVRSLVGTLVQVGEGNLAPERVAEILAERDRGAAGPVAPPHGLALVAVEYDEGWSLPGRRLRT